MEENRRVQLDGIVQQMISNNEPDENIRLVVEDFKQKYNRPVTQEIDKNTGAPIGVRMAVGNIGRTDALKTLKNYYPDAEPYGEDNFVYTDPKTKKRTLLNPKGFDIGDVAQYGRAISEGVGGALGGTAGALGGIATPIPGDELMASYIGTGVGAGVAGQLYDISMEYLNGRIDSRNFLRRISDASMDVVSNAAFPKIMDEAMGLVKKAGRGIISPIRKALTTPATKGLYQDFAEAGVQPTAGAISGKAILQQPESLLGGMPGSSNRIQAQAQKALADLSQAADSLAKKYGEVTSPQVAGETIKKGTGKAIERFKGRSKELYGRLNQFITPGDTAPISNTLDFLKKEIGDYTTAPNLGERFNKGILDIANRVSKDAPDGVLDFKVLQRLRTDVGDMLTDAVNAVDDLGRAQKKRLYGSISEDIKAAIADKGDDAIKAFKTADKYYSLNQKINIPIIDKIIKKGTDEEVYKYAMQAAKDGGSRLSKIKRNLTEKEWDVVSGTTLGRLGRATPGAQNADGIEFSANTFLTNWNRLSNEAKDVLFSSGKYKKLRPELDRLTRIASSLKQVDKMSNPSGTGRAVNYTLLTAALGSIPGAVIGGPIGAPISAVVGTTVAPYTASKLITSPKFVKWLADAGEIAATKPNKITGHISRLIFLAKNEPAIKDQVYEYMNSIYDYFKDESPLMQNDTGE